MARRSVPLLAALTLALVPAQSGAAVPKLSVRVDQTGGKVVSFFEVGARPGRRVRAGRILVANRDRRAVVVDIDPVDAITAANLGSAYEVRGIGISGPTRWTRLSRRRMRIPPGGEAAVAVKLSVPRKAKPGDYLSGVGIEARGQRERSGSESKVAVSSAQRYVIGLQANVPGSRKRLIRLTDARVERQPAGVTFLVDARNAGNAILKDVRGEVRVSREDGDRVIAQRVGPGTFVTATRIALPALARGEQPKAGDRYRVQAELRYRGGVARLDEMVGFGKRQARVQEDFGGPDADRPAWWLLALIAAAAVLALAGAVRFAYRRRRRLLSSARALELLDRHLGLATADRPVSVVAIEPVADPKRLAGRLRGRLRPDDSLAELGVGRLMVIAPATGARGVAGLAEALERALAEAASDARVGTATVTDRCTPDELIAQARPRELTRSAV